MVASSPRSPLLLLLAFGALLLASPAQPQQPPPCDLVRTAVPKGSYLLDVTPLGYKPGAIYTVTISGIENGTSLILQAVSSDEESSGLWEAENQPIACSETESLVQKNVSGSGTRTRWTSPSNANVASAQIRAFVTFANGTTLLQTRSLMKDGTTSAVTSSTSSQPTPGSHHPTLSNTTDHHMLHNETMMHHNVAPPHQFTKGPPHNSASHGCASFLLQVFSVALGYKLLA